MVECCVSKMKVCSNYEELMQELERKKLPRVGCSKLENILERCGKQKRADRSNGGAISNAASSNQCSVCDEAFFPLLLKEMSAVVRLFNKRAQILLDRHLGSGCSNCFLWLGDIFQDHPTLIQQCENLVTYASINTIAMRNILKKYDEIHYSKQGQAFHYSKSRAQSVQIEILHSPWLYELMAFHINLRESNADKENASALLKGCSLVLNDGNPSLSFELLDSVKLDIDLTCSICLETLFDPVSLSCGHFFCCMCACKAGSVSIIDGLKAVYPHKKCPICREKGVYESAVNLEELHILLKRSCPEYWEERRKLDKAERIQQAKTHWQSQAARFMGI